MKEKFTQGDWVVSGDDCCAVFSGLELVVDCSVSSLSSVEDVYNAMLIAAAPEMYRALLAMSKGEGLQPGSTIESILLKARGE